MNRGKAQQQLQRFAAGVRRIERHGFGRNEEGSRGAAKYNYGRAFELVVAVEDAEGIEAAANLSDRLTDLRQRAMAVGLLSAGDVLDIEKAVLAAGKGQG